MGCTQYFKLHALLAEPQLSQEHPYGFSFDIRSMIHREFEPLPTWARPSTESSSATFWSYSEKTFNEGDGMCRARITISFKMTKEILIELKTNMVLLQQASYSSFLPPRCRGSIRECNATNTRPRNFKHTHIHTFIHSFHEKSICKYIIDYVSSVTILK